MVIVVAADHRAAAAAPTVSSEIGSRGLDGGQGVGRPIFGALPLRCDVVVGAENTSNAAVVREGAVRCDQLDGRGIERLRCDDVAERRRDVEQAVDVADHPVEINVGGLGQRNAGLVDAEAAIWIDDVVGGEHRDHRRRAGQILVVGNAG